MLAHMGVQSIAVIGGCGHVGLPLALCFVEAGLNVDVVDIDEKAVNSVNSGVMPFHEAGADALLTWALSTGRFRASTDPSSLNGAEAVILVVGTPVDESLTPDPQSIIAVLQSYLPFLRDDQLLILRSTVYPGVTRRVEVFLEDAGWQGDVAFCPERILEGKALDEIPRLPQIVGGRRPSSLGRASELFSRLGVRCLEASPEEAELAKLFTNVWRYVKFAAANEFWQVSNEAQQDFSKIRWLMSTDYPRAADVPGAGYAAGPCLYKDTMQVSTFMSGRLPVALGAAAANEGLPLYVINQLASKYDLAHMTVAILGMAFKGDSDDRRASLSYKLKRILKFHAQRVLTSDPYVKDDDELVSQEAALAQADLVIIGAPHAAYADLEISVPVADVWDLLKRGSTV